VTALGGVQYSADAHINGIATVNVNGSAIWYGKGAIAGNATVIANGTNLGHNWTPASESTNTWTDTSVGSNTWVETPVNSNTWLLKG
jgi:hypothetical protein